MVLSLISGLFTIGIAGFIAFGASVSWLAAAAGLIVTFTVWRSRVGSPYTAIFIEVLAATYLCLAAFLVIDALGWFPEWLANYVPPVSISVGTALFALLTLGLSYLPSIRAILEVGDMYFSSRDVAVTSNSVLQKLRITEGGLGAAFLIAAIVLAILQVALTVRFSYFSRDMYDALQNKDAVGFWYQLYGVFIPCAVLWVLVGMANVAAGYLLKIRWRAFLTKHYTHDWLGKGIHYRLQLIRTEADNPDQRIAEDLRTYVEQTTELSTTLLTRGSTLISFVVILWTLSEYVTIPGTELKIPGLLVWVCLLYAILGTALTHLIGRPLIPLNFAREAVEADFRFSAARLREYPEQIALLKGEPVEEAKLNRKFGAVVDNTIALMIRTLKVTGFTFSYNQANVVFPFILAAPFYFLGRLALGQLMQIADAFGKVQEALNYFVDLYLTIAPFKAAVDRLVTFRSAIAAARKAPMTNADTIRLAPQNENTLALSHLRVDLPTGSPLLKADDITLKPGESVLVTGPSGAGKSTLFRSIAGLWPYGKGTVDVPRSQTMMLLPQRPYIPIGTLRDAVSYPAETGTYSDEAIADALRTARLPQLAESLDRDYAWSQTLSLGEQQRIAIARALLAKPDWLFLDEATAALDEPTEDAIYRAIKEKLPQTTIVSIGHRSTLDALHDRKLQLKRDSDGPFTLAPAS